MGRPAVAVRSRLWIGLLALAACAAGSGAALPPASAAASIDWAKAREHWSFRVPQPHGLPVVRRKEWPSQPLDAFILARLEKAQLTPSPEADPRTLIRRATFDLTGLPPTPEEVEAFVSECVREKLQTPNSPEGTPGLLRSKLQIPHTEHRTPNTEARTPNAQRPTPNAYQRLIDRLLSSPSFGERMASMWLPLARYAEDQAHQVGDDTKFFYPNAFLYRQWVVDAFNRDLPYDRFVRWQLAADAYAREAPASASAPAPASGDLAALGFLGLGPKYYNRNRLDVMADEWQDRVDTVTRTFLGLTVACARCHDHKYDPITTEDYYALAGVFASSKMVNKSPDGSVDQGSEAAKMRKDTMHVVEDGAPQDLNVFVRGDVESKGAVVPRRFLRVLSQGDPAAFHDGSGRKELADAIASPGNPLTARVMVNRVWGLFFGSPLVGTPSNFGLIGDRPTHPELLDDLAVRFEKNGWSVKALVREIVLSSTYRQASGEVQCPMPDVQGVGSPGRRVSGRRVSGRPLPTPNAQRPTPERPNARTPERPTPNGARGQAPNAQRPTPERLNARTPERLDPTNVLLWRMNRRRLTVEQWRDSVLSVTGTLQRGGGPSVDLLDPANHRRTLYARISRLKLNDLLMQFDYPDANVHAEKRSVTTTPMQKLFVLNSPFMLDQAHALAAKLTTEPGLSTEQRIARAYSLLYGRAPSAEEVRLAVAYLAKPEAEGMPRWDRYAQVLLAANEMLYLD